VIVMTGSTRLGNIVATTLRETSYRPKRARRSKKSSQRVQSPHQVPVTVDDIYAAFSPERLSWKNVDWVVAPWMFIMHAACLVAPFFFSWSALGVCLFLHWLTGSIGVCLGYHRFLSHKSLKLSTPARFFTLLCGSLSGEGSPLCWAATHRLHHQRSDQTGDPHSPNDGGFWAHMGWMFVRHHPFARAALYRRFVPDLLNDRMLQFFEKSYFWWQLATGVTLYCLGGWPWLLWGLCVRLVFMYHSTWFVNSATHIWGYRNYETRDLSRNLWWVAVLAYGEGWHNNHHAHPHSARAGHKWWELDPTFWAIRTLQFLRLASQVDDRNPAIIETPLAEEIAPLPAKAAVEPAVA
jgi:stearoyl-CoA desaturase (delta-9 desaturase)